MIQKIKQCFNNIKYRSKLILLCILVSFLPLSVMGFFCYNQTIKLLRARELSSLESTVTSVSDSLDSKSKHLPEFTMLIWQTQMYLHSFLPTMMRMLTISTNI